MNEPNPKKPLFSTGFKIIIMVLGLLLACGVAYGEWLIYQEVGLVKSEQVSLQNEVEDIKKQVRVLKERQIEDKVIEVEENQKPAEGAKEIDTSDWQVYKNEEYGFEFKYSPQWTKNVLVNPRYSVIELYPLGKKRGDSFGYNGDIHVWLKPNPEGLSLREFYNGVNDIDLFSDADYYEAIKIGDRTGIKFMRLIGISGSSMSVIPLSDKNIMFELKDVYDAHIADGIFDTMLHSIKFK